MKRCLLLLAALVLLTIPALAASADLADWDSLGVYGDPDRAETWVGVQTVEGEYALFLPGTVDAAAVTFQLTVQPETAVTLTGSEASVPWTGGPVDLTALGGDGASWPLTVTVTRGDTVQSRTLTVYAGTGLPALYLVSQDPVNQGRDWVESSPTKDNKAKGSMVLLTADSTAVYDGGLTQIKGRGNSNWTWPKKPYQIKLSDKTDLLQTGEPDNASKTWVLLANYADATGLRNTLALGLGLEMGMDAGIQSRHVELYYDGQYRGLYQLSEKVEVGSGRVDITDLEDANEAANPGVDLEALPVATGQTANGATYTYCQGMADPADITGGYLLEMDTRTRATAEVCYFYTNRDHYVVVKSPEYASQAQMDYIATLYQEYEDALYHEGVHPTTGKRYGDYVEEESTAACYLINELTKNLDGFTSSAFLYKEAGVDRMTMGPLWDYDLGFGLGADIDGYQYMREDPQGMYTACSVYAGLLYQQGDFRMAARELYLETIGPAVDGVILGESGAATQVGAVSSLADYRSRYAAAADRDGQLWRGGAADWTGHVAYLERFLTQRNAYLETELATWNAQTYRELPLYLDVDPAKWYNDEIIGATKYGLMKGTGTNRFSPETVATRAQVVQTIYNMADPLPTQNTADFTDLVPGRWYQAAIAWAVEHQVANGYPDGTFRPDRPITRQELVTVLYRYTDSPAVDADTLSRFADGGRVNAYARPAMAWAVETGLVEGYPDGTLRPSATTKRSELAAIMVRYYERAATE